MSRLAAPQPTPGCSPLPRPPHAPRVPTGVRTNLLTLQPALRTLTNDYNGLKRQVRGFPLLLQEALKSVKAEVSAGPGGRAGGARGPGAARQPPRLPSKGQRMPPDNISPHTHCHPQTLFEKQPGQGRSSYDSKPNTLCISLRPKLISLYLENATHSCSA